MNYYEYFGFRLLVQKVLTRGFLVDVGGVSTGVERTTYS